MANSKGTDINKWIPRCGHPKRKTHEPCQAVMMKNGMGCAIHGGKSKVGAENPNYDLGRYSAAFKNSKLGERVERMRQDRYMLDVNEEIIIVSAILEDLLERLANGEVKTTKNIRKTYDDLMMAGAKNDWDVFNLLLAKLGNLIEGVEAEFALMEEIRANTKLKKELSEAQTKREIQLDQMMKAEDVQAILAITLNEIRGVIYDRVEDKQRAGDILTEISQKLARHRLGNVGGGVRQTLPDSDVS